MSDEGAGLVVMIGIDPAKYSYATAVLDGVERQMAALAWASPPALEWKASNLSGGQWPLGWTAVRGDEGERLLRDADVGVEVGVTGPGASVAEPEGDHGGVELSCSSDITQL